MFNIFILNKHKMIFKKLSYEHYEYKAKVDVPLLETIYRKHLNIKSKR